MGFNNHTLRMNPRVSIGGDTLRVRVSNAHGAGTLAIGAAYVGIRDKGPAIVPGSQRKLTFGGAGSATVAAGALIISDSVTLDVEPLADLAVTLYLPGEIPTGFQITGRYARQTNYISPPGNFAAEIDMPVGKITDEWFFVSGIDVLASSETGGVVAFGDSLTDANISTHDAHARWPDQLARRLIARQGGRRLGVMNQGLGGNRILHDLRGESGLRRFDRDVLAQPGVTHAIVMLGTGMPTLRPVLDAADWNGPPVTSSMISLAWRTVLQMDGIEPSAQNMRAWSRGEGWGGRMPAHDY